MKRRSGQTIVEYVLIISLILVAFTGVFSVFSKILHKHWAVYSKVIAAPVP